MPTHPVQEQEHQHPATPFKQEDPTLREQGSALSGEFSQQEHQQYCMPEQPAHQTFVREVQPGHEEEEMK